MSVKTNQYAPLTADTGRGPSMAIWNDCPIEDGIQDMGGGLKPVMQFGDDFLMIGRPAENAAATMGMWGVFCDTTSVFTDDNEEGGSLLFNHATAGKGITMASIASAFKLVSGATGFPLGQKLWFECRVAMGAISGATEGYFIGLADETSSSIVSGANTIIATTGSSLTTTKGLIGFSRMSGAPTDWAFKYQVAGGTVVSPTGLTTLGTTVTGTAPTAYAAVTNGSGTGYLKLGFVYDPTPANVPLLVSTATGDGTTTQTAGALLKPMIQVFVNGVPAPAFLDATLIQCARFPTKRMSPVIAFMDASGGGGSSTGLHVDWIRVAQLGSF